MVKAILLELQFLDPSHIGVCLAGYRAYLLDDRYGKAIDHPSQKCRVAISHVKEMSEAPKSTTGQIYQNVGWPKGVVSTTYGHRVFVVANKVGRDSARKWGANEMGGDSPPIGPPEPHHSPTNAPNGGDKGGLLPPTLFVKGGSQLAYIVGKDVSSRWTGIHDPFSPGVRKLSSKAKVRRGGPFLETNWEERATIPTEFITFQSKCKQWKGPVKAHIHKFLYDPRLFEIAYGKLRSNPGNMTPGINPTTLDGMSGEWIKETIASLKNESFQFASRRRIEVKKPKGGTRPLTIAPPRDKIVMEGIRMILEAIYEPRFSSSSHGFRSGHSCHTALRKIREQFGVASWYIEGDISKCFDTIEHHKLMNLIESVILDRKFTRLLWKSVRAGYFSFREYQNSIIGTPQGSVISPILANIYMDQLDKFVEEIQKDFNKGDRTKSYKPYKNSSASLLNWALNKRLGACSKPSKQVTRKMAAEMRRLPSRDPMDPNFRRLIYIRYADDWIIGIRGTNAETLLIKHKIQKYLQEVMGLSLNAEKTLITHAATGKAFFLGTYIFKARVNTTRKSIKAAIIRNGKQVRLEAPIQHIVAKLTKANFVRNGRSWPKLIWLQCSLDQIITLYNAVMRGYLNFYSFVENRGAVATYVYYLLRGSCAKLIAAKMKLGSIEKVFAKYGKSLTVNAEKKRALHKPDYKRKSWAFQSNHVNSIVNLFATSISPASLLALPCALCGRVYRVEMHHVRHLKHIEAGKSLPEKLMMRHKLQQIPLCRECHMQLHRSK
jgi:group II intron reverse transcriptase/maturase